jgi:16S rRNA (cytidine1402-2'-O)-methyltransferase
LTGKLYLVATPIGNMGDISARAIEVLNEVSLVACEDTRITGSFLKKLNIKKKLLSYYEHNQNMRGEFLLSELKKGLDVALVSDAGTPAISDPGEDIVAKCIENDIEIIPIPGACAFVCGLITSGFSTKKFTFVGFLPHKANDRKKELEHYKDNAETLIFYESPHRLKKTLADMSEVFSEDRKICLSREITKKFEEHRRCNIKDAIAYYETNLVKGEFVIIVAGNSYVIQENMLNDLTIENHLAHYLNEKYTKNDAIKKVAKDRNIDKRDVYNYFCKKNNDATLPNNAN